MAAKIGVRGLAQYAGLDVGAIEEAYRKTGDLGDAAQEVMKSKNQTTLFEESISNVR